MQGSRRPQPTIMDYVKYVDPKLLGLSFAAVQPNILPSILLGSNMNGFCTGQIYSSWRRG